MNAKEVLQDVETVQERVAPHLREGAEVFYENEGELFIRERAVELVSERLDVSESLATDIVSQLVSDTVDPVIQVVDANGSKRVGVAQFKEFDGAYGYINFDDMFGEGKRVVCQQCVNDATVDTAVTHATENDPNGSFADGASWDELLDAIHAHYESSHSSVPNEVKTGATLASGTTIGSNTAFHAGNDGANSGLSADTLQGKKPSYFSVGGVIVEAEGPIGNPNKWSYAASLSTKRQYISSAELDGLVYAIGGSDPSTKVDQYDPTTDTWSSVASMNTPRSSPAAVGLDGYIYVAGGINADYTTLDSVEKYDPATDNWTTVASMGTVRANPAGVGLDGYIYVAGGINALPATLDSVEKYDPATDNWTTVASMGTERGNFSAVGGNGSMYVMGGQDNNYNTLNSVEKYDPGSNTWTNIASLNKTRQRLGAAEVGGLIYAIGGKKDSSLAGSTLNSVEEYDPNSNTWTYIQPLNEKRSNFGAAVAGGSIYAIGGRLDQSAVYASVEESEFNGPYPEDVYSATGDALIGIDDPNGVLLNRTTGREVTSGSQLARDGETIAAATETNARVYRTEER